MDAIWTEDRLLSLAVVELFMSNFMHREFVWEESQLGFYYQYKNSVFTLLSSFFWRGRCDEKIVYVRFYAFKSEIQLSEKVRQRENFYKMIESFSIEYGK